MPQLATIVVNSKAPAAPLLLPANAGDGSFMVTNLDHAVTVYLSPDPGYGGDNTTLCVPLGPGQYIVVDGTLPLYAFTLTPFTASVSLLPTGVSAGPAGIAAPVTNSGAGSVQESASGTYTNLILAPEPAFGYILFSLTIAAEIGITTAGTPGSVTADLESTPFYTGPIIETVLQFLGAVGTYGPVSQSVSFGTAGLVLPIGYGLEERTVITATTAVFTETTSWNVVYSIYS